MSVFQPTWVLRSLFHLQPADLKRHHISTILTDLDNTLVAWHESDAENQAVQRWLEQMQRANIQVIVVSNNNSQRVGLALAKIGVPFVATALKPLPFGIKRALKTYHLNPQHTIMVGDQLMTDILAGHFAQLKTVLVKPLVDTDNWTTWFNREVEKIFIRPLKNQNGQIEWQERLDDRK